MKRYRTVTIGYFKKNEKEYMIRIPDMDASYELAKVKNNDQTVYCFAYDEDIKDIVLHAYSENSLCAENIRGLNHLAPIKGIYTYSYFIELGGNINKLYNAEVEDGEIPEMDSRSYEGTFKDLFPELCKDKDRVFITNEASILITEDVE
jgi:hypothetical protein